MTQFSLTDLLDTVDKVKDDATAAEGVALEQRQIADESAAEAAERDRAAAGAAAEVRRVASNQYTHTLRRLTGEVLAAQERAAEAVRSGGDALGMWVAWRTLRAEYRARWRALEYDYIRTTGDQQIPPGNWGPPIRGIEDGAPVLGYVQTFDAFVTGVMAAAETEIEERVRVETHAQLDARREARSMASRSPISPSDAGGAE